MYIIVTEQRFVIRDFLPEEAGAFSNLFSDELVTRYLPKRNVDEYAALFKTAIEDYDAGKSLGRWGIFNTADNDLIGMCLLRVYHIDPRQIELGYSMHQKYWGRGIATAMAKEMIAYCFSNTDSREVVAVTTLDNIASQRVLEKAGLVRMENVVRNNEELAYFRLEKTSYLAENRNEDE